MENKFTSLPFEFFSMDNSDSQNFTFYHIYQHTLKLSDFCFFFFISRIYSIWISCKVRFILQKLTESLVFFLFINEMQIPYLIKKKTLKIPNFCIHKSNKILFSFLKQLFFNFGIVFDMVKHVFFEYVSCIVLSRNSFFSKWNINMFLFSKYFTILSYKRSYWIFVLKD